MLPKHQIVYQNFLFESNSSFLWLSTVVSKSNAEMECGIEAPENDENFSRG